MSSKRKEVKKTMSDYFQESQFLVDEDMTVNVGTPEKNLKYKRAEKVGQRFAKNGQAPSAPKKLKVFKRNLQTRENIIIKLLFYRRAKRLVKNG